VISAIPERPQPASTDGIDTGSNNALQRTDPDEKRGVRR
jgi:hypothetical protein